MKELIQLVRDAAAYEDLRDVLTLYLNRTRGVYILRDDTYEVLRAGAGSNEPLFSSRSYIACVEFALVLPVKEKRQVVIE